MDNVTACKEVKVESLSPPGDDWRLSTVQFSSSGCYPVCAYFVFRQMAWPTRGIHVVLARCKSRVVRS